MMAGENVKGLLPNAEVNVYAVSAVLCGSATAILAWRWARQRRVQKKLEEAKKRRELDLQQMEKAARQFKQQVNESLMGACRVGIACCLDDARKVFFLLIVGIIN